MAENTNTIKIPQTLIIGAGNTESPKILNSGAIAGEPFDKTPYTTIGINGKGNETANVDLTKMAGVENDINTFSSMRVYSKEIQLKIGEISLNDENYAFLYDNRTKEIAQVLKQDKESGKLIPLNKNDFLITPKIKGKDEKERIDTVLGMLDFIHSSFAQKDNEVLKKKILEAINNAKGNLNAQNIDLSNIKTLRDKIIFTREVLSKMDFNDSVIKNAFMEFKEEFENGENLPTVKNLKDNKENFLSAISFVGVKGITFKDFRKLTKTESMLGEKPTLTDKTEFDEIQEVKKQNNIDVNILNGNTIYAGVNDNGEIMIYENKTVEMPSNGEIYADMGLAEKLKPIHKSLGALKTAVFNPDKIEKEKVVKAENVFKEKLGEMLETETDVNLKKHLESVMQTLDVNNLYAVDFKDKNAELNKFREVFNYLKKRIILETEKEFMPNINLLTKDNKRIRNISLSFKTEENKGFDKNNLNDGEDIKDIKEHLFFAEIPTLASFGEDLFEKNKTVITARAYANIKNNEIKQIDRGANISNQFTMLNLGKMIDNISKYDGTEDYEKKYLNELHNGLLKYFYLNQDEKSLQTSDNFKKSVELIKPELSKLVEMLKEKKFNEAKDLVNSWSNSENRNLKIFAKWAQNVGEKYFENKMFNNLYFALSQKDETAKNMVMNYLKQPDEEKLNDIINNRAVRKYRKPLTEFAKNLKVSIATIDYQLEQNIQKFYDLNGGVDENRVKYNTLDNYAKNVAFDVTNTGKIYYMDKNYDIHIMNTMDNSFRKLDSDLVKDEKVEYKDKNVIVYSLNKDEFTKHIQEKEENKNTVVSAIAKEFTELEKIADKKIEYTKKEETVGEAVSFSGIDFSGNETEENVNISEETELETPKSEQDESEKKSLIVDEDELVSFNVDEEYVNPDAIIENEEKKSKESIKKAKGMGI